MADKIVCAECGDIKGPFHRDRFYRRDLCEAHWQGQRINAARSKYHWWFTANGPESELTEIEKRQAGI